MGASVVELLAWNFPSAVDSILMSRNALLQQSTERGYLVLTTDGIKEIHLVLRFYLT